MRRIVSIAVFGLMILIGGAFLFLKDKTYLLTFTEPELRDRLEDQLPFTETYLFIFQVTLKNPRIDLVSGSDRIAGGLDVVLNLKLGDSETPLGGGVDVSGGLKYLPSEGAFYLDDPVIEQVNIQGLTPSLTNRANQALSSALSQFYRERPIYRLSESDIRQSAAKVVLREVIVKDEVLHVTLGLSKKSDDSDVDLLQ